MDLFHRTVLLYGLLAPALVIAQDVRDYPTGPLNPRVPIIQPEPAEGPKWDLPFEAEFRYSLQPWVAFPDQGHLNFQFRDNLERAEKPILSLQAGDVSLTIHVTSAATGRTCEAVLSQGKTVLGKVPLQRPASGWSSLSIDWSAKELHITQGGTPAGTIALATPFAPTSIVLQSWHVADLSIDGDGQFTLDWADGYAAHVTAGQSASGVAGRLLGFDTDVISLDPAKRDCPMLQLFNAGPQKVTAAVTFALIGEVNAINQQWSQSIDVPGRSEIIQPISFPSPLKTDVYHLTVSVDAAGLKERRNFIYVQRRDEPAGPPKFGLHDSAVKTFGQWPDALPVDFAHVYATWAVIQGPPWTKDSNGDYGIDPALPPEQWNWTSKVDAVVQEGHLPWVCLGSQPFQDWQRKKLYPEANMIKYAWGWRGGTPDDAKYRHFLDAVITRYKGKVWAYEIENEPNTNHGFQPADYAGVAKDVFEEVKSLDPHARVYGICGTSLFVDWMQQSFNAGAAKYMDGVSWHTYVTPSTPEESDLRGLLAKARQAMTAANPKLTAFNSETGTYVATREVVDQPIADARLEQLLAQGVQPLVVTKGWPSRAATERAGSVSLVTNAITNFLAGAEGFVFFGWNLDWPKDPQWWNKPFDDSNFSMFAATKDGERTPTQFTLAAGVLTAQLEPAIHTQGVEIHEGTLRGAIFLKKSGGELAVLWSTIGRQTVLIESPQEALELVSMFGQPSKSTGVKTAAGTFSHAIEVGEEPIYVQQSIAGLKLLPNVMAIAEQLPVGLGQFRATVNLQNRFDRPWAGTVKIASDDHWTAMPAEQAFSIAPGAQSAVTFDILTKPGTPKGRYPAMFTTTLPDGRPLVGSGVVTVTPSTPIAQLPADSKLADLREWDSPPLMLDHVEQVVVGRPPALASLQEKQYWGGANELSGKVKIGSDAEGLAVYVEVRDANAKPPKAWPGVDGSCVELFFDFRAAGHGLGTPPYTRAVSQLIVRPPLEEKQPLAVWKASTGSPDLPSLATAGGRIDATHYWVAIKLPWKELGVDPAAGRAIGFDVGIDGAKEDGGRKSQLMLFGKADGNRNASGFGLGFLPDPKGP